MKPSPQLQVTSRFHSGPTQLAAGRAVVHCVLVFFLMAGLSLSRLLAQDSPPEKAAAESPGTNAPAASAKPEAAAKDTNAAPASATAEKSLSATNLAAKASTDAAKTNSASSTNAIQVSFQGANIDMIAQWLAQTTGKSVVKHPQVQCQLTIMSSKKVTPREAINLVYRALSLEGFTAVESADSILLVPQDKEPKLNPEVIDGHKDIPEGRQRLVKIFPLAHLQAADLREKLRGLLSEKGTIDLDERANQLVVTDYNDNLRLLAELIREFDVPASGQTVEIYLLKYADAEELASLIGPIVNSQPGGPSGRSGRRFSSNMVSFNGPPPSGDSGNSSGGGSSSAGGDSAAAAPQVRIWPDKPANRLIVFAAKAKQTEVQRLVEVLDTEKPEDVTVRIIPLKNVNATDLVREIQPLYQKVNSRSQKDTVEVAANDRSNSLIILASLTNFKAIEKLVAGLDTEDAADKVMRTFPLKNADAEDVAKQLQDLNRDQDNSSSSRYRYFFSGASGDRSANRKLSVVADRRRNSLIVQAPPTQMDNIEKMIKELDEPITDDSLAPRIFPLKYVSAVDVEDVLNELFLKKTQNRGYWDFWSDTPSETTDRDVGRLYGKVRITCEPYANVIIVTSNSKESLTVIEDVLKQLDAPTDANESTLRLGLKFAKASIVANSVNILFAKNGSPPLRPVNQQPQQNNNGNGRPQNQQNDTSASVTSGFEMEKDAKEDGYFPWIGGQPDNPRSSDGRNSTRPVSDLVGRVRVVPDERSNSLLISANVHFFPQLLKLVNELDAPTEQVLIEARLVEVSTDNLDKIGVRWTPDASKVTFTADDYDNSFLGSGSANYTTGFGGNTTVNTPVGNAAQLMTTLRSGVLASTVNMDLLIQFLRRTTDARVLAEPQINIRDNESGRLFVGQQVPTLASQNNSGSIGFQQNFIYKNVGIILEVTPHINDSGDIELKIHAESSTVVPGVTILGGAVFDTRYFHSDLTAKTGQTLVVGGIIQKQISDITRKVPLLGDIPGLGWVFKKKDKEAREVELMVFLRPRVTKTPKDASDLLEDIYKKAPHIKDWQNGVEPGKKAPAEKPNAKS
jgi:type II secretion system protein D